MKKYLVRIEFRYNDVIDSPKRLFLKEKSEGLSKFITVGVYDDENSAISAGNKALEKFEKRFKLKNKSENRFSSDCYLVTNIGWIKTPFDIFANIIVLNYEEVDEAINDVLAATKRYQTYINTK